MKNIAIFVSGAGESAERIVKLFNEGNRLRTVLVVADDSAVELLDKLKGQELTILHIPDEEWHSRSGEVVSLLRDNDVKLIVLDEFTHSLSDEILEAVEGEMIKISSPEQAPREVVAALEADLRKPQEENTKEELFEDENPTPESEWADALKINFTPPKVPTTPPAVPLKEPKNETQRPWGKNPWFRANPPRKEFHKEYKEPMPSTWLIWSILVTVFCCFIPGIIAVIFSSQVSTKYYAGDIEGSKRASRAAEIWIIVSFVLGVLAATLYIPFMMLN